MAEFLEDSSKTLESTTVYLWRNAKVVKGGRRFSLSALVVVGDRNGSVGIGYGKAAGAPAAIEKAQKNARKSLTKVVLKDGTIPHEVTGKFCASKIKLIPAAPGTGVKAGASVRAVLEMAGVKDCMTKSLGSANQKNLVKATMLSLLQLQSKDTIAKLRGVDLGITEVEEKIEAGMRYLPQTSSTEKAKAPVNKVGQKNAKGGGGRGRGGRGRGRGGDEAQAADQQQQGGEEAPKTQAPATEAPAAEAKPAEGESKSAE
ncbi:MAG: 30S ribosomal protein S5 [Phycisphaeraceae bacterium]|nr:30S ribosomal protein S5 [Phycisphaeraceae bacterium]